MFKHPRQIRCWCGWSSPPSPSIRWMSLLQSFTESSHSPPSSLSLLRNLRVLRLNWLQLLSSWTSAKRCVLAWKSKAGLWIKSISWNNKIELASPFGRDSEHLSYLSLRFLAMGLANSLTGFISSFCFSSWLLTVFAPHFALPDEPRRPLLLCLRLLPPVDDFLRYSRDW